MKRLFALMLTAVLMISLVACSSNKNKKENTAPTASSRETLSGGWTVNHELSAVKLPEDVQKAFDKNFAGARGAEYIPVAYLGTQVVSGLNHAILCKSTSKTDNAAEYLSAAVIYTDTDGNSEITDNVDFVIANYTNTSAATPDQRAGGWSIPDEIPEAKISDKDKSVFDKALENYNGTKPEPVAMLGTQVVAGTNYAFLCLMPAEGDTPAYYQIFIIYADLNGKTDVINATPLDLASLLG